VNVTRSGETITFKDEKARDVEYVDFSARLNWTKEEPREFNLSPAKSALDRQAKFETDVFGTLARIAREHPGISQTKLIKEARAVHGLGDNGMRELIDKAIERSWLHIESGGKGKSTKHYAT
jgi:hypothetical protein